jgi:hypothetical protein
MIARGGLAAVTTTLLATGWLPASTGTERDAFLSRVARSAPDPRLSDLLAIP